MSSKKPEEFSVVKQLCGQSTSGPLPFLCFQTLLWAELLLPGQDLPVPGEDSLMAHTAPSLLLPTPKLQCWGSAGRSWGSRGCPLGHFYPCDARS